MESSQLSAVFCFIDAYGAQVLVQICVVRGRDTPVGLPLLTKKSLELRGALTLAGARGGSGVARGCGLQSGLSCWDLGHLEPGSLSKRPKLRPCKRSGQPGTAGGSVPARRRRRLPKLRGTRAPSRGGGISLLAPPPRSLPTPPPGRCLSGSANCNAIHPRAVLGTRSPDNPSAAARIEGRKAVSGRLSPVLQGPGGWLGLGAQGRAFGPGRAPGNPVHSSEKAVD